MCIRDRIDDAPIVIAVGPGFTAKKDCDYVIETKRGHFLGKVIEDGSAIKNTGVPAVSYTHLFFVKVVVVVPN